MVFLTNEELVQKIIENKAKYEYYKEEYDYYYGIFMKRFHNEITKFVNRRIKFIDIVDEVVDKVFTDFFKYAEKKKITKVSYLIFQFSWQRANNMIRSPKYKERFRRELKEKDIKSLINYTDSAVDNEEETLEEDGERVRKALKKMPEKYRIPLMMKDRSKYKYSEIEEVTNININTLKSRVRRAREMIIYYMKEFKDNDTGN